MTHDSAHQSDALVPAPEDYIRHLLRLAQQVHLAAWLRDVSTEITSVQFAALSVLARTPGGSAGHPLRRPRPRPIDDRRRGQSDWPAATC